MDTAFFPDGSRIPEFFEKGVTPAAPRAVYCVTDYGVRADWPDQLQTAAIQRVIDLAASEGGGEIRFPGGHYRTGALFFKPGTTLHLEKHAVLQGSDDVSEYPLLETRIEGENVKFFAALVNADKVDDFAITGEGTLDGCGLRFWKSFWLRLQWKPDCLNMDEQRPRLVYVSNSRRVLIAGVRLHNSAFWTTHLYRCTEVELRDLDIFAPRKPVPAPSSDAVDLDNCFDVWIHRCRMEVNDDAVTLKGGKGPAADTAPEDGPNARIIIEDCFFGFCHSALTCGSECVDNRDVVMRNCTLDGAEKLLYLKMRPDTPQLSRDILIEKIKGRCQWVFMANSWAQFRRTPEIHFSRGEKIELRDLELACQKFFYVVPAPKEFALSEITFHRVRATSQKDGDKVEIPDGITFADVEVNGRPQQA